MVKAWAPGQKLTAADASAFLIPQRGVKASATARSAATVLADPDLQVSVAGGGFYVIEAAIRYTAPAAGSLPYSFTIPGGAAGHYGVTYWNTGGTLALEDHAWTDTVTSQGNGSFDIAIRGFLATTSPGVLAMTWGSPSGTTSILAGSVLISWQAG